MTALVPPPRWSPEQLEAGRSRAIDDFRSERLGEPLGEYLHAFDQHYAAVVTLLGRTSDLRDLSAAAPSVTGDAAMLEVVRYLAGPPISADDLGVLAGVRSSAAVLRADPDAARRVVEIVLLALDGRRFPWVAAGRAPAGDERASAVAATAALMAAQRAATRRRTVAKSTQEDLAARRLADAGLREVPTVRVILTLEAAPARGAFCRETTFGTRKADLLVGLWDGRKMPLECKVSNSEINSIKRLNNDAAVKAEVWAQDFGRTQVVPAAVLSGVFKRAHLESAQDRGLSLWWSHDLDALADWVETTR